MIDYQRKQKREMLPRIFYLIKVILERFYINYIFYRMVSISNKEVILKKGDRICQIIFSKMYNYGFIETDELPQSDRSFGGFGSTGTH